MTLKDFLKDKNGNLIAYEVKRSYSCRLYCKDRKRC